MDNNGENRWIDEVLTSTDGMQKASPSDSLFFRIEQRQGQGITYAKRVPLTTVSMAAASIALLVVINVTMLKNSPKAAEQERKTAPLETVIDYYGLNEETVNF